MTRLVCLGDSFTEGMVDTRRPDGHFTGWADRVALGLAQTAQRAGSGPVEYANLAVRGKLLDQVVDEQLEVALAMNPDVVTFHAGPNDVLRPGTDFDDLVRRYESAVRRLSDEVDRVILFTSLARAGGSGRLADRLEARFIRFNASVRQVADRQGCLLVDDEAVTALADRRFWGVDRLHLNELGTPASPPTCWRRRVGPRWASGAGWGHGGSAGAGGLRWSLRSGANRALAVARGRTPCPPP